jgi:hypothetical protein
MPGIGEIYFLKNSFKDLPTLLAHNAIEPKRAVTIPMSVATLGGADEVNAESTQDAKGLSGCVD